MGPPVALGEDAKQDVAAAHAAYVAALRALYAAHAETARPLEVD